MFSPHAETRTRPIPSMRRINTSIGTWRVYRHAPWALMRLHAMRRMRNAGPSLPRSIAMRVLSLLHRAQVWYRSRRTVYGNHSPVLAIYAQSRTHITADRRMREQLMREGRMRDVRRARLMRALRRSLVGPVRLFRPVRPVMVPPPMRAHSTRSWGEHGAITAGLWYPSSGEAVHV